jgi:hypothetical protein
MRTLRNALRAYVRNPYRVILEKDLGASKDLNGGLHWYNAHGEAERNYIFATKPRKIPRSLADHLESWPGIETLGAGSYGVVIKTDGRVYKMCYRRDKGYSHFIKFCKEFGPSRFLPVFDDTLEIRGLTVYGVEELQSNREDYSPIERAYCKLMREPDYISSIYDPELFRVLRAMAIYAKANNCRNDMHGGNFMMRGENQIVITDPWTA